MHQNETEIGESMLNQVGGKFWSKMAYKIDDYFFSLDDIEHGVLRSNRPHPSRPDEPFFGQNDPRLKFVVKNFDPRIHFALNCGAKVRFRIYRQTIINYFKYILLGMSTNFVLYTGELEKWFEFISD